MIKPPPMTRLRSRAPGKRHSFTLIELLVVIAIGAILAVISAGAYSKIVRSTTVSTSSQMLTGALDFARQTWHRWDPKSFGAAALFWLGVYGILYWWLSEYL